MTKKKPNEDAPKFVVKKRTPKQKPNLFENVTPFSHPLEDILKFPAEELGNPNENILDSQTDNNLATQNFEFGNPDKGNLDSQIIGFGNPNSKILATQVSKVGQPNEESLDSIQPKNEIWQAKTKGDLDSNLSKKINLASQKSEKTKFLKKYDQARSTEPVNIRPDKAIVKRVRHFIVENKMTLKDFFEHSATKYMDEFGKPNAKNLDSILPYDDRRLMTLYKTKPRIINLYLTYNSVFNPKSKWTVRDDEAGVSLNDVDLRIIELGIMQTQANKNFSGKINSFGYYLPEIENFLALNVPEDALQVMLDINRRNWNNRTGKSVNLDFLTNE